MYSLVVSGRDASSIVLITSTNGTAAMTALNRSGRMLTTAPIKSPPAEPPWIISRSVDVYLFCTRYSATSMKSLNVFIFFIIRPASRHSSPSSPPPRMLASAHIYPRSSRESLLDEKPGS